MHPQDNEERDLFGQFARIEWLFHRYHLHKHRHHGPMGDPHRGQGRILAMLRMQPEISQKDLSYLLDMRPQSLGELLGKLEKNGLIERTPSESDRRVMQIQLTEAGKTAAEERPQRGEVFDCLNEDEQQALQGYLARLIESLEGQLGSDETLDEELRKTYRERMKGRHFPAQLRGYGVHGGFPHHGWGPACDFDPRCGHARGPHTAERGDGGSAPDDDAPFADAQER